MSIFLKLLKLNYECNLKLTDTTFYGNKGYNGAAMRINAS